MRACASGRLVQPAVALQAPAELRVVLEVQALCTAIARRWMGLLFDPSLSGSASPDALGAADEEADVARAWVRAQLTAAAKAAKPLRVLRMELLDALCATGAEARVGLTAVTNTDTAEAACWRPTARSSIASVGVTANHYPCLPNGALTAAGARGEPWRPVGVGVVASGAPSGASARACARAARGAAARRAVAAVTAGLATTAGRRAPSASARRRAVGAWREPWLPAGVGVAASGAPRRPEPSPSEQHQVFR
jgi:hypothetical protein